MNANSDARILVLAAGSAIAGQISWLLFSRGGPLWGLVGLLMLFLGPAAINAALIGPRIVGATVVACLVSAVLATLVFAANVAASLSQDAGYGPLLNWVIGGAVLVLLQFGVNLGSVRFRSLFSA